MMNSLIQEVRRIREQHAASLNHDLDCIFADLKTRQAKHAAEGWQIIEAPASPPPEKSLVLQRARFGNR
jgi:hypothetical protein